MTDREKKLLAAIVGMGVVWGGWQGWQSYQGALQSRRARIENLEDDLSSAELQAQKDIRAQGQLIDYRRRSLPVDPNVAQSAYREWLQTQLRSAGLNYGALNNDRGSGGGDAYSGIAMSLKADGDLASLIKFLHAFYTSGVLHKITRLDIVPSGDGAQLSIDLGIEALMIEGAKRDSGVPDLTAERLNLASFDDYSNQIVSRNIFKRYSEPKSEPEPNVPDVEPVAASDPFDHATRAKFSAVVEGAERRAWVWVQTTGERFYLSEGDDFEVGTLKGRVVSIDLDKLILTYETPDGEQFAVRQGDFLTEGKPVATAAEAQAAIGPA